jgi:hypothetical protein
MATVLLESSPTRQAPLQRGAAAVSTCAFALTAIVIIVASCLLAGWAPLGFSIATVFLFAGPHNWLEARYMLTRMPARWGSLTGYFSLGIAGVVCLSLSMAALHWLADGLQLSDAAYLTLTASWNTALLTWIIALALVRSHQNPRRNWSWLVPIGLVLIALNWLWPLAWSLALVYSHPLVALWFLDREIDRVRPAWRSSYRGCLVVVPACLAALWWRLAAAPDLSGNDWLSQQIASHAGGDIVGGISTHFLVSAHTFLEMLHYGVWIVAIPLISVRMAPWRLDNVPLVRRSRRWQPAILAVVGVGGLIMLALWAGFLADYPLARDIYFTVAIFHVLAEVPFLLRLL